MKFKLGYVAISRTLEEIMHFHTMTYTSYQKSDPKKAQLKLDHIIKENLKTLLNILIYNIKNEIFFYRISHHIIPLATHPEVEFDYITPYLKEWQNIGKYIQRHKIRVDSHPDQFCVLNSIHKTIVENSIKILEFNYQIFQAMQIDGKVILHIGSGKETKEEAKARFKENFKKLRPELQNMIILENDDRIFNIIDVLELCEELNIPFVLDYHHYRCNHGQERLTDYLPRIFATWANSTTNYLPKIHFSSPKNQKEKRTHSTYIVLKDFLKFLNIIKAYQQDLDIMLECKGKDEALFRLSRQLKTISNIKSFNNTTFEI
ncbi:MAG: UV DNA damage repair endonuclease UvsE [bacterium]|nr:UV DNA damage repair endonuclease UvsE [bacterium]